MKKCAKDGTGNSAPLGCAIDADISETMPYCERRSQSMVEDGKKCDNIGFRYARIFASKQAALARVVGQ
jgi:hypothetical protein